MCIPSTNGLNLSQIFSIPGGKGNAARYNDAWQIGAASQCEHHGWQAFVAGSDSQDTSSRWKRPNQSPEHDRCIVAIWERVKHADCPLRSSIARVAHKACKRNAPSFAEPLGCRLHHQPHFPMTGVVPQSDGLPILASNTPLRAQQQELRPHHFLDVPAHSGILGPTEKVAARPSPQHLIGKWQFPFWAFALGGCRQCWLAATKPTFESKCTCHEWIDHVFRDKNEKSKGSLVQAAFASLHNSIVIARCVGRKDSHYRLSATPKVKAGMTKF